MSFPIKGKVRKVVRFSNHKTGYALVMCFQKTLVSSPDVFRAGIRKIRIQVKLSGSVRRHEDTSSVFENALVGHGSRLISGWYLERERRGKDKKRSLKNRGSLYFSFMSSICEFFLFFERIAFVAPKTGSRSSRHGRKPE